MANGVYIGMSAALAAQKRLEVVANNVANANSPGFKQQRIAFDQFLVNAPDGTSPQKGFAAATRTTIDTRAAALQQTGNPLDLALAGEGFFVVAGPGGPLLTRAGSLRVGSDGSLLDPSGLPVLGGDSNKGFKPIQVRPNGGPLSVASDGSISQGGTPLARLAIVTVDPRTLTPAGGAHLAPADPTALQAAPGATVAAGHLEASNVDPVRSMVHLIELNQDYSTAHKLMNESRKLDQRIMGTFR